MFCYYLSQYLIKEQLADCAQREGLNGGKERCGKKNPEEQG